MADEPEYSEVEVVELVQKALAERPALAMSWLETRLFDELYTRLSKYMNKVDLVYTLSELRRDLLSGFTSTTPQNLHQVCSRCRLCEDVKHPAALPSWNVVDPDLMIVLENPTVMSQHIDFLVPRLKAVGFTSNRCMITYITRCPIFSQDIQAKHVANCVPYLHTEMQACNPKAILVLGSKCWGAITGDVTHKITELEREIIWFGLYPMIPGMSLSWYARASQDSDRFTDLLRTAYNFLYSDTNTPTTER